MKQTGDATGGRQTITLPVEGRELTLTNLDKVLWPDAVFTKRQMVSYYAAIAPVLLPHIAGRPVVLKRYPDGVVGEFWFQTRCPHPPEWMRTFPIASARGGDEVFEYCVLDDVPSLLWAANAAAIELHPLLASVPSLDEPSWCVFDLDPREPAGLIDCCAVALMLRDVLGEAGLEGFTKTSGLDGLHVYVPLNSLHTFDQTKDFVRDIAWSLAQSHGERIVHSKRRSERRGKVLIDWSQNSTLSSTVAPYSLRAADVPSVSTPVTWDEVARVSTTGVDRPLRFTAADALARVDRFGDLFAPVLEMQQRLPVSDR